MILCICITVHTVTVLQDGSNRKKSDLMDLDVALSKLTETIESHMYVFIYYLFPTYNISATDLGKDTEKPYKCRYNY